MQPERTPQERFVQYWKDITELGENTDGKGYVSRLSLELQPDGRITLETLFDITPNKVTPHISFHHIQYRREHHGLFGAGTPLPEETIELIDTTLNAARARRTGPVES